MGDGRLGRAGERASKLAAVAGLGLGLAASPADATWSILIANTRTGEVAVASATCLTSINLQQETPVLIAGVGGATAQSAVDQSGRNRGLMRNLLLAGVDPQQIVAELEAFDPSHQSRQYGIIDARGGRATFTGSQAGSWAGGQTGRVGDLVYAVQGNVLTGAPVVQAAVDAIVMTPGDMPEKLMAGMEAAFLYGGDGRCSCNGPGADGCGSPPNGGDFDKSAHVGYMLIARAGDMDGCNAIMNTRGVPLAWVIDDFDKDGRVDAACVTTAPASNVSVLLNATMPGAPMTSLAVTGEADAGARSLQSVAAGDFTGDGETDLMAASLTEDAVSLLVGLGGGAFDDGVLIGVGDGPRDLVAADLDGAGGLDVAVANQTSGDVSIMLGAGDGTFAVSTASPVLGSPTSIVAGEFNGQPGTDLAMAHDGLSSVSLLIGDGAGAFVPGGFFFVGAGPVDLAGVDLDGDGLDELVTANESGQSVTVLKNTGGAFTRTDYPMPPGQSASRVVLGNLDGDATIDMAVFRGGATGLAVYTGDGAGGFTAGGSFPVATGVRAAAIADFSGDGLGDVLVGASTIGGAMQADNLGGGVFLDEPGCAAGEYYMEFNVPNVQATDPDPVLQMRVMFDAWRGVLTGRPDAVQSSVSVPTGLIATGEGTTGETARVRVNLFDWRRVRVDLDASAIHVSHAMDSDGATTILGVERVGAGRYDIVLEIGPGSGVDEFVVTADDGQGPVTLMPAPIVRVLDAGADFDGDGAAGYSDVLAFLVAFAIGDPSADLDADTEFTIGDVLLFLALYNP